MIDVGPKNQEGWNFTYETIDYNKVIYKINDFNNNYKNLHIEYRIMETNEISDIELFNQVKCRNLYNSGNTFGYSFDHILLRGLHCHYNFQKCGEYILKKEKEINSKFNFIVYVRPDLYFTTTCDKIDNYNNDLITLGNNFIVNFCNDHLAIIPRKYLNEFFFNRMEIYRNNTTTIFCIPEEVYKHNIPYEVNNMGSYYIKRK